MKAVARIITRMTSEKDGLFIGVTLKGNNVFFKPNSVYEVREVLGEPVLIRVGDANVNWKRTLNDIVDENPHAFLTKEEYEAECKKDNSIRGKADTH